MAKLIHFVTVLWKLKLFLTKILLSTTSLTKLFIQSRHHVMLNSSPPLVSEQGRGLQGRVSLAMYQHLTGVVNWLDPETSSG